jgi:death-on-curing protein
VTVEYLDVPDFIAIAAGVTGLDVDTVMAVANLDLADSALHAPSAGFGDTDFYPEFVDKGRSPRRAARQEPSPARRQQAHAWVALRVFVPRNSWTWSPMPSTDDAERAVLAIASGDWDETAVTNWLSRYLAPPQSSG